MDNLLLTAIPIYLTACQTQTRRTQNDPPSAKTTTFLLWGNSANDYVTMLPQSHAMPH